MQQLQQVANTERKAEEEVIAISSVVVTKLWTR